ncbi:MAG: hypothetical protein K0R67_3276, partial [Paenibacillus sp.]|nr:hypothetical protein [Paenibacillus sp.]
QLLEGMDTVKKRSKALMALMVIATLISGLIPFTAVLPQAHAEDSIRKALEVNKTLTAPVIDGKLDDSIWTIDQPLNARMGEGTFKDSRFGLLWDNKYLYIGVKSDDDTLTHNGAGYWFEQDNINIFLDPTQHRSTPFANDDMQLGFVFQPGTTTPEFHFGAALNNHSGKDEKKILRAIQTTNAGWSLEVAVPWDMMNVDPVLSKELGIEIGVTDRYDTDASKQRSSYWSAFNSASFWNDTAGYGTLTLSDSHPVAGNGNPVLLEENFDSYATGQTPFGWISDVNAGSNPFTVVQDTYGNGRMLFDGKASGKQARITAPVQWDNYVIEADVKFESVLDSGRWASLMFRGASNGKNPYNQMAIRQRGTFEVAYRKPDNNWSVIATGESQPLTINSDYTMKVRVFDNNVKEYIKAKSDPVYKLLIDKSFTADLLERGKVGFQVDQSKVSFDNLKVTRITADQLNLTVPATMEALTGPVSITGNVQYSDGVTDAVYGERMKLYSSDESVIKIMNNQLYPIKAGQATVKTIYYNAEATQSITVTPSTMGAQVTTLKHDDGYVLVSGETLDLDTVEFKADFSDFSSGTLKGGELTWTANSGDLSISNGTMHVQRKGVYPVTVQKDGKSIAMLIVAKDAADQEYVLYEENFDSAAEGSLPSGWTRREGTTASAAAVKSGAFELNANASPDNPSRVLLPDYLGMFGNYKIEADVTHLAANDAARWHSIMYRIQSNDYPYYQMAVRKDATAVNGVEFAERTPANGWNVMEKGSYTEAIDAGKLYHYSVKTFGNRVQQWIGDKLVVDTDLAAAYAKGRIGLQSNGSTMKVDNIRVVLQQDPLPPMPPKPEDLFVKVTEPESQISMAPSVVMEMNSVEALAALTGPTMPATVIVYVNGELEVTDSTGSTEIGSLDSVLGTLGTRMIPAFYVRDELTVDLLMDVLKSKGLEDAFVISDKGDLVKRARTAYPIIRGIVDFSADQNLSEDNMLDIRRKTTTSLAKIALLPQNAATRQNVSYLQQRVIVVWTKEEASQADKNVSMHNLIASGTNGIVTNSPSMAFDAYKVYSNQTTLVRKPYIIAHRGMPAGGTMDGAPENTIISNKLGLEAGADFIENDIFLSKDGRLVIVHDFTLDGTTNGTGLVESFTYDELMLLDANQTHKTKYPSLPIPTLDEQIELAREKGKMIYAEIKTNTPAAVDAFVQLIKDKDAEDMINPMSFDSNQLKRLAALMPELPGGLLTGGYANEANVGKSLRDTLKLVQNMNVTYNTSYGGLGKNFMEAAKHRGILISPWTFNNKNDFIRIFKLGAYGITTDFALWASDWAAAIKPEKDKYELAPDESLTLSAVVDSYAEGKSAVVAPDLVLIDGQDVVEVNGSTVTGKKPGTAHALLRYTTTMDANNKYDIYTKPVVLEVKGQDPEQPEAVSPVWTNGKLTAASISQTGLVLTWSGASDRDGVTEYRLYQGNQVIGSVTGSINSYEVSGLTAGTEYNFTVQAGNQAGKWSGDGPSTRVMTLAADTETGTNPNPDTGTGNPNVPDPVIPKPDGGKPTVPDSGTNIIEAKDGKVDAAALKKSFEAAAQVEVNFSGEKLELSAAGLLEAARKQDSALVLVSDNATYHLPLSVLKLEELAQQLQVNVNDLSVTVTMKKLGGSDAAAVDGAVNAAGGQTIADAVEFEVQVVGKDGQAAVVSFGTTYVSRDLVVHKAVDTTKATGVQYVPETKQIKFVPTVFETKDGKTTATMKRNGNSIYTVVENNKSFADMADHWARADVELL